MDYNEFSRMELKILMNFWNAEKPMTTKELSVAFNLNKRSVTVIVRKLLKFNILEVDRYVTSGKRIARSFRPKITESEFLSKTLNHSTMINLTQIYLNRIDDIEVCNYLLNLVKSRKRSTF
jgi:predicted transcriptional regulator